MPRRRPQAQLPPGEEPEIRVGSGPKTKVEYIDPQQPMPGTLVPKQVKEQRVKRKPGQLQDGRRKYQQYLRLWANHGDRNAALAQTLDLTVMEVEQRADELHEQLLAASGEEPPLSQVMRRLDLTPQGRLTILAEHAHSDHPAASLKAIEIINDMDAHGRTSRDGVSAEDYVRIALERRKHKERSA